MDYNQHTLDRAYYIEQTFIALAIGTLGLRRSSNAQLTIAERAQNYTIDTQGERDWKQIV